jgi:hypothetical protein
MPLKGDVPMRVNDTTTAGGEKVPTQLLYAPVPANGQLLRKMRHSLNPKSPIFWVILFSLTGFTAGSIWRKHLAYDEQEFNRLAEYRPSQHFVQFSAPPTIASLRHLARLPGRLDLDFAWNDNLAEENFWRLRGFDFRNVTSLSLNGNIELGPWIQEIARPGSGFRNLQSLNYPNWMELSPESARILASPQSSLKALTSIDLIASDSTLELITRPDCGLQSVKFLMFSRGSVSESGMRSLARKESGLKALRYLSFQGVTIADGAMNELTKPGSGLDHLTELHLSWCKISHDGLANLARSDTGLKSLESLSLLGTIVSPKTIVELSRPNSGLAYVTTLDLTNGELDDEALKALARPDSGLSSLRTLILDFIPSLSDDGLRILSQRESGLQDLNELHVCCGRITVDGLRSLMGHESGLKSLRSLHVSGSFEGKLGDLDIKVTYLADPIASEP